jgi:hypothetical protein
VPLTKGGNRGNVPPALPRAGSTFDHVNNSTGPSNKTPKRNVKAENALTGNRIAFAGIYVSQNINNVDHHYTAPALIPIILVSRAMKQEPENF